MTRKLLVAYSMTSTFVQTTMDYLLAAKRYSGYDVSYVHVTHGARMDFDFSQYDIIFNNYCARWIFDAYVSDSFRHALKNYSGLKVLSVQDEYEGTNKLKAAIKEVGF